MTLQTSDSEQDVLSRLQWRYATKKFDASRKIDPSIWGHIEKALVLTPSSFGLQPWKFVVITDNAVKEKLPPLSWNQRQVADCSHLVVISRLLEMTAAYVANYVDHVAKVRGLQQEALSEYKGMVMKFLESNSPEFLCEWMTRQCYIALGNLMTTASMYGVDNCPMEGFSRGAYDELLDLPSRGCRAVVVCALGYRAADDRYSRLTKVRFPASQLVINI